MNDDSSTNESEILPADVGEKIQSMAGREIYVYDVKTLVSRGISNIQVTFLCFVVCYFQLASK
jgi:hypothetical protein